MKNNNKCDIIVRDGNVVVTVNGKDEFCKPKSNQTIAIARDIYFAYQYEIRGGNINA